MTPPTARIFLVDPDGQGLYAFSFESPDWFRKTLSDRNFLAWMGFIRGCEERMQMVKAAEALAEE